jgi:hypothetical protein
LTRKGKEKGKERGEGGRGHGGPGSRPGVLYRLMTLRGSKEVDFYLENRERGSKGVDQLPD